MSLQITIFGTEERQVSNLKDLTYELLRECRFLAECRHAHKVALQLAKEMEGSGVVSTEEMITMKKSTYTWIVQNIANIERYIRDFNEDEKKLSRGYHVSIESVSEDFL